MKIRILHGWQSVPGGVNTQTVIRNPAAPLTEEEFDKLLAIAPHDGVEIRLSGQ